MKKRYEVTDNKSGEKFFYTNIQWEMAFLSVFLSGLLT